MIKLKKLLKENPDTVYLPLDLQKKLSMSGHEIRFNSGDSYVFGYWNDHFIISDIAGDNHLFLRKSIPADLLQKYKGPAPINRDDYKYAGRVWKDYKIISFWDYPSKSDLRKVMKDLKKSGIPINDKWYIEVIDKKGKYEAPKLDKDRAPYEWKRWSTKGGKVKLVPIKDYIGSEEQLNKGQLHALSPMLKRTDVPAGWGSRKKVPGAEPGEVPAATRFWRRTGLGDGIVKLKKLIEWIREGNADEMVKLAKTASGLIDPKGNVYAVPSMSHLEFLTKQPKWKKIGKSLQYLDSDDWSDVYIKVMDEALKDGWVRIAGWGQSLGIQGTKKAINRHKALIDDIIIFIKSQYSNMKVDWEYKK